MWFLISNNWTRACNLTFIFYVVHKVFVNKFLNFFSRFVDVKETATWFKRQSNNGSTGGRNSHRVLVHLWLIERASIDDVASAARPSHWWHLAHIDCHLWTRILLRRSWHSKCSSGKFKRLTKLSREIKLRVHILLDEETRDKYRRTNCNESVDLTALKLDVLIGLA